MKYIRTKDGRIITFLNEDRETKLPKRDLRFYYVQPNNVIAFIGKDEIINQADTIEELCDEFVVVANDNPQQHQFMKPFDYYMRSLNTKDVSLFGAIWTDKGLIYVAKMNDKGELELL